jgi:hypothetical protein
MIDIGIVKTEGALFVAVPYSKDFVNFAHMRGAKWSESQRKWMFDLRDEFALRSIMIELYGTDDYETCEKVTCRVAINKSHNTREVILFAFGRVVARMKRAGYAVLGEDVVIITGELAQERGASLFPNEEALLEIRGVPVKIAEQEYKKNPYHVTIIGGLKIQRLRDEREALIKRLSEIEETIQALEREEQKKAEMEDDIPDEFID